jgi:hypothetical protein
LPIIGVDISGQVGVNPPVYSVAVKLYKQKQVHHIVYLSPNKHDEYASLGTRNWREKVSAILIYLATVEIYTSLDTIVIDVDFEGRRRKYVTRCLERLFGVRFQGRYPLNSPSIIYAPRKVNEYVKVADKKSKLAHSKRMEPDIRDPNLQQQLDWLEIL